VLVKSHGGPTSVAPSTLSLSTQYWTRRGAGVLDVNYRGSTGYGRPYRLRLEKQWGLVDLEDCVAGARWLVANRNADPKRLMISGGSAGGYTTLCSSVQRWREPLRRERPRGPRARHTQIRVPLSGLANWSLSTGQTDLCRTIPHQPRRSPLGAGNLLPGIGGSRSPPEPDRTHGRGLKGARPSGRLSSVRG